MFLRSLVVISVVSSAVTPVNQELFRLYSVFGRAYKQLCDSDWVHVDDSGVAVRFQSVFLTGDVEQIAIAPISAMHNCASVPGSIYLREEAIAFYDAFMRSAWMKTNKLKAIGDVRKLLEQGSKDKCAFIGVFKNLVDLLSLVKKSFNELHEFYVLGFIHYKTEGHCKADAEIGKMIEKYVKIQAGRKVRYDRISRIMTHNFFNQLERPIERPSADNEVYLLQLLGKTFKDLAENLVQGPETAVVVNAGLNPLTGVKIETPFSKTADMRFRLMVANDGKLAKNGMILNYMIEYAKESQVDFLMISEGTVAKIDEMQTIAGNHGYSVFLPVKTGNALSGGVGLGFRSGLLRYVSQVIPPTATGFDLGVLGVKDGVTLTALYTSPTRLDAQGRAIKALKNWSTVANALLCRVERVKDLEHESIVAGDMNAASGTEQRLVFDAGMRALDFHLLNEGMFTYQKGMCANVTDIDLS